MYVKNNTPMTIYVPIDIYNFICSCNSVLCNLFKLNYCVNGCFLFSNISNSDVQ